MEFGIAETGIARGSPPGTTTEVLRVGFPSEETRVVSICAATKASVNIVGGGSVRSPLPDASKP
jgi:hypothetical protein